MNKKSNNIITADFDGDIAVVTKALYQWDTGQVLQFKDIEDGIEVQFGNENRSDTVSRIIQNSQVEIPDFLLQEYAQINAYVQVIEPDNSTTVKTIRIPVRARSRPADYVNPDGEQTFREYVQERMELADASAKEANAKIEINNTVLEEIKKSKDDTVLEVANEGNKKIAEINKVKQDIEMYAAETKKTVEDTLTKVNQSEANVKVSEDNSKESEINAKKSEDKAKKSETGAKESENNAKQSELRAKDSETNASTSETNANQYKESAKTSADNAKQSEMNASQSAKDAKDNANALYAIAIKETVDGNMINIQDSADFKIYDLKIFGNSMHDGEPTPESPVDITSIGDGGNIEICVCKNNQCEGSDIQDGKRITINFTEPLRSVGDFRDEIVEQNGQIGVLRRVYADKSLDFSKFFKSSTTGRILYGLTRLSKKIDSKYSIDSIWCKFFKTYKTDTLVKNSIILLNNNVAIMYDKNLTSEDFVEWAKSVDFSILYPIEEPIFEPFSDEIQEEWKSLRTYSGVTNIFNSENAEMECTYVADSKMYIYNKFAELAALTLEE